MNDHRDAIGTKAEPHSVDVERGRLRFFANVTGQSDQIYSDLEAARKAGHPDLPVPPTFLFCLNMEEPHGLAQKAGVGGFGLHGEQKFIYHAMAYAGDRLTFSSAITDVYTKKGGALLFLDQTTEVTRDGEPIATLVCTPVFRREVTS